MNGERSVYSSASLDLARCDLRSGDHSRFCSLPAARHLVFGCVHEHLLLVPICQRHVGFALSSGWVCNVCLAVGEICDVSLVSNEPVAVP